MQHSLDLTVARDQRDAGIAQAVAHAEQVDPTFKERAYAYLVAYAKAHNRFTSEHVTDAARAAGLVSPTDQRAWGGPFKKAANAGIIQKVGFGISLRRHLSPTPLWQSGICP